MIRIGICDDSSAFLLQTKFMLDHWDNPPSPIVTELFEDGDSLLQAHAKHPFDLILLDIVMPLLNGIDAAKELRESDKAVKIVFLSSSCDFAVDSYSVKASNYLLKPLNPELFFACLHELITEIRETERCISIRTNDAVRRIRLSNIAYIEAQNKHILFSLIDGSSLYSIDPLYSYESRLLPQDGFFKCHRSFLVNIHHIDSFSHNEITMLSGKRIPISRRYQNELEDFYFSVLFGKAGDTI